MKFNILVGKMGDGVSQTAKRNCSLLQPLEEHESLPATAGMFRKICVRKMLKQNL